MLFTFCSALAFLWDGVDLRDPQNALSACGSWDQGSCFLLSLIKSSNPAKQIMTRVYPNILMIFITSECAILEITPNAAGISKPAPIPYSPNLIIPKAPLKAIVSHLQRFAQCHNPVAMSRNAPRICTRAE